MLQQDWLSVAKIAPVAIIGQHIGHRVGRGASCAQKVKIIVRIETQSIHVSIILMIFLLTISRCILRNYTMLMQAFHCICLYFLHFFLSFSLFLLFLFYRLLFLINFPFFLAQVSKWISILSVSLLWLINFFLRFLIPQNWHIFRSVLMRIIGGFKVERRYFSQPIWGLTFFLIKYKQMP